LFKLTVPINVDLTTAFKRFRDIKMDHLSLILETTIEYQDETIFVYRRRDVNGNRNWQTLFVDYSQDSPQTTDSRTAIEENK